MVYMIRSRYSSHGNPKKSGVFRVSRIIGLALFGQPCYLLGRRDEQRTRYKLEKKQFTRPGRCYLREARSSIKASEDKRSHPFISRHCASRSITRWLDSCAVYRRVVDLFNSYNYHRGLHSVVVVS